MAIATTSEYWNSRMNGTDPTDLPGIAQFQQDWTLTGNAAAASGDYWQITNNSVYSIAPSADYTEYTLVSSFIFSDAANIPNAGTVLMSLDNGTHKVEVKSKGNASTLDLVGATTTTTEDLDLAMAEDDPVAIVLRLTLDSSGTANLYMRELIDDDNGTQHYISVTGASGSGRSVKWGNDDGTVKWASTYYSQFGAFSPNEMMLSDYATNTLSRMGLSIVDLLKNSKRLYLKTQVNDASIMYGFDLSADMLSRSIAPMVHVVMPSMSTPEFLTLGASKVKQTYDIEVYVTTRGTNYENAYRDGLNIAGEIFDELFTKTGVNATTDSIIAYNSEFDVKLDNDDTICTHRLRFTYMRLIDMRQR
tara:strand:- start:4073 stop:5158 length:1086 start_codon:yes stop_codon:yes gene_type:complete